MKLLNIVLSLFGEGGGESTSSAPAQQNTGETQVVYGKQTTDDPTPGDTEASESSSTPVDKAKAFQDLINGEYKDEYQRDFQKKFDKRFKDHKQMESALSESNQVLDVLKTKYGVNETSEILKALDEDSGFWEQAADEAGMTVEQYKEYQKMRRESQQFRQLQEQAATKSYVDAQLNTWITQAEEFKAKNPSFDLRAEVEGNPDFLRLLKSNIPVEHAYNVIHHDEIVENTKAATAQDTKNAVVNNIRSRGNRPNENGSMTQSAFIVKDDPSKFSRADRAEIARRAMRGERITL